MIQIYNLSDIEEDRRYYVTARDQSYVSHFLYPRQIMYSSILRIKYALCDMKDVDIFNLYDVYCIQSKAEEIKLKVMMELVE